MNVLVLGGGGREHSICWKLSQSRSVDNLFCAPGNPGTALHASNVGTDVADFESVANFATDSEIDVVIVGPEDLLANGVADALKEAGIRCLGPLAAAARIESSKAWAKNLMAEAGVPTAAFEVTDRADKAFEIVERSSFPIVVKADGLALGKGVTVAGSLAQARQAVQSLMVDRDFGDAGDSVIIEDCLFGQEVSAFAISDGRSLKMLPFARDFKRVFDNDDGPNTGSMGCYSPVAIVDPRLADEIETTIMRPTLDALARRGTPYVGFLYAGLMIGGDGPRVVEFNCRLGDPEAQAILPLLDCDFAEVALLAAEGRLDEAQLRIDEAASCCIVAASGGYPGKYRTGHRISGIAEANDVALVFQAGSAERDGILETSGGRVLSVVGRGKLLGEARNRAYEAIGKITFSGAHYRTDIAATDPERIPA